MSHAHPRAVDPAPLGEDKDHVRHTIGTILLFLLAVAFAALVAAPAGDEAAAAAAASTDSLPTFVAGS